MTDRIYVEGELYLALETVADIYRVEAVWLREAFDAGILGEDIRSDPTPCIAVLRLDHVATVVRLHRVLGLDLDAIRDALEEAAERETA